MHLSNNRNKNSFSSLFDMRRANDVRLSLTLRLFTVTISLETISLCLKDENAALKTGFSSTGLNKEGRYRSNQCNQFRTNKSQAKSRLTKAHRLRASEGPNFASDSSPIFGERNAENWSHLVQFTKLQNS